MSDPIFVQGLSVSGVILAIKSLLTYFRAMGWWDRDDEQFKATNDLVDTLVPFAAVWIGVLWVRRKVTPLDSPRDVDDAVLSRPDNSPAMKEMEKVQTEATKINEGIENRRIKR